MWHSTPKLYNIETQIWRSVAIAQNREQSICTVEKEARRCGPVNQPEAVSGRLLLAGSLPLLHRRARIHESCSVCCSARTACTPGLYWAACFEQACSLAGSLLHQAACPWLGWAACRAAGRESPFLGCIPELGWPVTFDKGIVLARLEHSAFFACSSNYH